MLRFRRTGVVALIAGVILTLSLTVIAIRTPPVVALFVVAAVPLFVAVLLKASARLVSIVIGALLVFQSTSDALKYVYLALALVCVVLSLIQIISKEDAAIRPFRPLLIGSPIVLVYLTFSAYISHSNGATTSNWFHDVLPYILMVILPIVGLDASRHVSPRALEIFIGILGVVGAIGIALDWIERRGVSAVGVGRIILSTFALVSLAFAVGAVRSGLGPRRLIWTIALTVMGAGMILSGSRSNLVVFLALLAVLGPASLARVSVGRMVVTGAVAIALTATLVLTSASYLIRGSNFLQGRFQSLVDVLNGGAAGDASYDARSISYSEDWAAFHSHLLLGTGPGYLYSNGLFGSDAATLILAKWGLLGSAVLLAFLVLVVVGVLRSKRITGPLPIHTAAFAWGIVLLALLPLGPWLEDKGFALALTLLVTTTAASVRVHQARNQLPSPELGIMPGVRARRLSAAGPTSVGAPQQAGFRSGASPRLR